MPTTGSLTPSPNYWQLYQSYLQQGLSCASAFSNAFSIHLPSLPTHLKEPPNQSPPQLPSTPPSHTASPPPDSPSSQPAALPPALVPSPPLRRPRPGPAPLPTSDQHSSRLAARTPGRWSGSKSEGKVCSIDALCFAVRERVVEMGYTRPHNRAEARLALCRGGPRCRVSSSALRFPVP
jgi:hypothetical protein